MPVGQNCILSTEYNSVQQICILSDRIQFCRQNTILSNIIVLNLATGMRSYSTRLLVFDGKGAAATQKRVSSFI